MKFVSMIDASALQFEGSESREGKCRHAVRNLILFAVIQLTLISCAREPAVFTHSFGFDTIFDSSHRGSPEVEILDYQYGSSEQFGTQAPREKVERGEALDRWQMYGPMTRGEFLYVKWRIKSSQEIYEETVDLKDRLPHDVTDYGIHFVAKGKQLCVYLIPPPGTWRPLLLETAPEYLKQHQIYPDSANNTATH